MTELASVLIGVGIGGLVTGGINLALQVRGERRELRAVARLMLQELSGTGEMIRSALDRDDRRFIDDEPNEDAWDRHQLLLARHLSDDDWDTVALGYGEAAVLTVLVDAEDASHWRDDANGSLGCIDAACSILQGRAHRKGWEQPDL